MLNLPYGGLAMVESDGGPAGPGPALFSAVTRNSYSVPSIRSVTLKVVSVMVSLVTRTQRVANFSLLSRMKLVMRLPPSDSGGDHLTVICVAWTSLIVGLDGAPGTSDVIKKN